jgi:hypothetical protein
MLRSLRLHSGRLDWGGLYLGRIWPVGLALVVLASLGANIADPERMRRIEIESCLRGVAAAPIITIPCAGNRMDESIAVFLSQPENQHLEVAGIVPFSKASLFGSSGTIGFKVILREKR